MNKPCLIKAICNNDLTVSLLFSDNMQQVVNVGEFIRKHPHPQYNKYLRPANFKKGTIENGNVVWGKNWDLIFPIEQLHTGRIED